MKQIVPYDTGKVKIGLMYQPPKPPLTYDGERLQTALLRRRNQPTNIFNSLFRFLTAR